MKHIDEYMDFLIEAYNTPVDIDWEIGPPLVGRFKVLDLDYKIYSDVVINGFMTYKFKYKKDETYSDQLLNKGGYKISVIPTIKSGLDFILNDIKPNGVIFSALDESKGRKNIYDRYCKSVDTNIWDVYSKIYDDKKIWVIYKKGISGDIVFDTIKYCGDNLIDFI